MRTKPKPATSWVNVHRILTLGMTLSHLILSTTRVLSLFVKVRLLTFVKSKPSLPMLERASASHLSNTLFFKHV